ncbi:hypothetical protein A6R68_16866 [Neotoma lepida]|uniref:Uncharacterized protein n=1 Tax=Neotoma lepida TaxID=56216 RepID=A0A1A6HEI8_NEOLE|nr:hypothetical protein A6R68_16866 [Neotoma lepida]
MSLDFILRALKVLDLGNSREWAVFSEALKVLCWCFWVAREELYLVNLQFHYDVTCTNDVLQCNLCMNSAKSLPQMQALLVPPSVFHWAGTILEHLLRLLPKQQMLQVSLQTKDGLGCPCQLWAILVPSFEDKPGTNLKPTLGPLVLSYASTAPPEASRSCHVTMATASKLKKWHRVRKICQGCHYPSATKVPPLWGFIITPALILMSH